MSKVSLISFTKDAEDLLIFSKNTRLKMEASSFENMKDMPEEEKKAQLEYVFGTISSSWEFVDYVFLIEGVTRAFTHQLVRHRVGTSFAQQTMRAVDMSGFPYAATGDALDNDVYHDTMHEINRGYQKMINEGMHPQDARGVLPTNITTNILFKANLRTLSGIMNIRMCVKAQGEFQDVAREMRQRIIEVHPWAEKVLQVNCVQHLTCAFPGYQECDIKNNLLPNLGDEEREIIKKHWEENRQEATPYGR
jgi:flavin-dependent thymidylate synthase